VAEQKAGLEHIEPVEAQLGEVALDLALDPQVKRLGCHVGAGRTDMHEPLYPVRLGRARDCHHQVLVDRAEDRFVLACLLPGRA
jgi:hypothetical protein